MPFDLAQEIAISKAGPWFTDQKFATKAEAAASTVKDPSKLIYISGETVKWWTYNSSGELIEAPMVTQSMIDQITALQSVSPIGTKVALSVADGVITVPFNQPKIMTCTITESVSVVFSQLAGRTGAVIEVVITGTAENDVTLPETCIVASGVISSNKCKFLFELFDESTEEVHCSIINL